MLLVDEVSAAIADAMRKRDPARLSALRMLKAALVNRSVEKARDLVDAEARQVVVSLVKQRRDSVDQFSKGGRQDLADKEAVLSASSKSFFTIPHFEGYAAVLIQLKNVTMKALRDAVIDGWLACAPRALADQYLNGAGPVAP